MTSSGFVLLFLLLSLPCALAGVIRRTPTSANLVERDMAIFFIDGSIVLDDHRKLRSRRGFRKGEVHYTSSRKQRRFLSRNFNDQLEDEAEGELLD